MEKKGFIEEFALFASLSVSMIGNGVFYAPAIVTKYVGQNGWIVALITGLLLLVIFLCISKLISLNKNKDLTHILTDVYGNIIGRIIAFIYSFLIVIVLALLLRSFSEIISMYLLSKTPTEIIIVTLIFIGMYLSRGGLANVVHFNEIVFWIMFIPIGLILLLTLPQSNFSNILPIGGYPIRDYASSSIEMLFLLSGFSVAFILLPYVRERNKIKPILTKSCIFVAVFYAIIFIIVCATLSSAQAASSIFPTITMLQSIGSNSGILEKWDSVIMALWVIFYFTSFANIYYFASYTLKDVLNLEDIRTASTIYVPFVYLAAVLPENVIEIRNLKYGYLRIGFIATVIVVIGVTLIISMIKKGRHVHEK